MSVPFPRARLGALLALAPLALASSVLAQSAAPSLGSSESVNTPTPSSRLDEVTVTGTRSPMRLSEVLADLTVLNRNDIERQAFGTLADLLRNRGGVEMTRNGGPGSNTSLFLRGAEARHTVVLIDGVRVDSQSTGGASWQNLPLSQIERVEILKGPASALYGSDAIGGVVQIFTRQGSGQTQLDLALGGGNLGQQRAEAGVSGGSRRFSYAASLAVDRGDGFNSRVGNFNPDKDSWRNASGSLRLSGELAAGQRLEFSGLKSRGDSGYDTSNKINNDRTITETQAAHLGWTGQWTPSLSTQLTLGEAREDMETKPTSPYLTETRIRSAALQAFYKLAEGHQLNGLLERREDHLVNSSLVTGGADERTQNAVGLSYLLSAGAFSLQAHGRVDDDSQFDKVETGSLAAGLSLGAGWRVTASLGNAFRAPSLYQRGSQYGPDLSRPGVEALRPERGHNREVGLSWRQGDLDLGVTTWRNEVKDLIVFGSAGTCPSTQGCYANVSRATLQGVGVKASALLGPVRLSANVEFTDPTDDSTGKTLQRRAKRFGSLRADTQLDRWTLGATLQASGQRWDNAANTTRLGGYGLLNLDAQYSLNKAWRLAVNLDNAFDRRYMTANGYNQAPRTWLLMLRYSPTL